MSLVLDFSPVRTLDRLIGNPPGNAEEGLELWTFDDRTERRKAERQFLAKGISARCNSAYKPLLHFFREHIAIEGLSSARVAYPVHPAAPANRFLLETYPLAGVLREASIDFVAKPLEDRMPLYDVEIFRLNGARETYAVPAPNRLHPDPSGHMVLSPTGWMTVAGAAGVGERLVTDYESIYLAVMEAIDSHSWPTIPPLFPELDITVKLPADDEPVGVGKESVSLREALHEDLYFSVLERLQRRFGCVNGDRSARPGRIVPQVVRSGDDVNVRVVVQSLTVYEDNLPDQTDSALCRTIGMDQIRREMESLKGEPLAARSVIGVPVVGRYLRGTDEPVLISGGQHANEGTGVAGALGAALSLVARTGAHFAVWALENPDGYALHRHLCQANPCHMHHAARFTALGNDLENHLDAAPFEKALRVTAAKISGARLHLNLHGYPAHEWTRPMSGYIPRGYEMWTLPKGFVLIARYQPGWEDVSRRLLEKITLALTENQDLMRLTAEQIRLCSIHAGEFALEMMNGFPIISTCVPSQSVPVMLITEFPDETIYDDAFRAGRRAQMDTVLSAYDAWQEIMQSPIFPTSHSR